MIEAIIIDADLCIKLGGSDKHKFLYEVLPLISDNIYMHEYACKEVMFPASAVSQLKQLIGEGKVILTCENELNCQGKAIYDATYKKLEAVMIDPRLPRKNKGEVCSLAYAKASGIPIFATDEKNLQPIIDKLLNTGIDDITCMRIVDIINLAHEGKINISRKYCKALWIIANKPKELFDSNIWPLADKS